MQDKLKSITLDDHRREVNGFSEALKRVKPDMRLAVMRKLNAALDGYFNNLHNYIVTRELREESARFIELKREVMHNLFVMESETCQLNSLQSQIDKLANVAKRKAAKQMAESKLSIVRMYEREEDMILAKRAKMVTQLRQVICNCDRCGK